MSTAPWTLQWSQPMIKYSFLNIHTLFFHGTSCINSKYWHKCSIFCLYQNLHSRFRFLPWNHNRGPAPWPQEPSSKGCQRRCVELSDGRGHGRLRARQIRRSQLSELCRPRLGVCCRPLCPWIFKSASLVNLRILFDNLQLHHYNIIYEDWEKNMYIYNNYKLIKINREKRKSQTVQSCALSFIIFMFCFD